MKGIVFTEFVEMVEAKFSWELAEAIIEECNLSTGGAYTSVGTYDHKEILQLVDALSRRTNIAAPDLVKAFGRHLFGRFVKLYPRMFQGLTSSFDFLSRVESEIHVEVRKLYPDAELPRLETRLCEDGSMELTYRSSRPFVELAAGLIVGCGEYFNEELAVRCRPLGDGVYVFHLATAVGAAV